MEKKKKKMGLKEKDIKKIGKYMRRKEKKNRERKGRLQNRNRNQNRYKEK